MSSEIIGSIEKLNLWIKKNGWAGFDPYDIKELNWVRKISHLGNNNFLFEIIRESIFEIFYLLPTSSRNICSIKPSINAKAMGLFAKAYLDLFINLKNTEFLNLSEQCLNWLILTSSKNNSGMSWGYPFDWQSKKLIPANTPNGIVTTAVGDAFWSWYLYKKDEKFLQICIKICEFLITLPQDKQDHKSMCFSYTHLYINHVHNLNLFVAEFLLKIGNEVHNQKWIDLANAAVYYTISDQRPDGSFDYNGPPEKQRNFVDNYHTGFVLRMLFSIWKLNNDPVVFKSLNSCYKHYINNFFENDEIPKLLPDRKYRIDIHSCAESINCLSELSTHFNDALPLANKIANWTIKNLLDKSGYFYYGILKNRPFGITYKSKIPYIRWGQAWMLKALSNLLVHQSSK